MNKVNFKSIKLATNKKVELKNSSAVTTKDVSIVPSIMFTNNNFN